MTIISCEAGQGVYVLELAKPIINPRRACAARVTVVELQATRRLMSDTNSFSATRARKIMWRQFFSTIYRYRYGLHIFRPS